METWWYIPKSVKPASKQAEGLPEGWYRRSWVPVTCTKEELENLDTVITEEVRAYYNRNPC